MPSKSYEPGLKRACTIQWSARNAPWCFCESVFPAHPFHRDYGEYQPLPNASSGIFLSETLHAARKTPNLPLFSCNVSILEREGEVEGVCVCCCPRCGVLWGGVCCQCAQLCRGTGWPAGLCQEPSSCVWAGRSSGAPCQQHCQRQPGSRAGRQDTALDVLQGLLSLAWSLHLASWHLRCARAALHRLCPVPADPGTGLGGLWESSLQQRQSLSCSPSTATATGTDLKNMPNPSGKLKMSALRGNGWVCQICCCLFLGYLIILVNLSILNELIYK